MNKAHNTHNPKVGGSNPSSATKSKFLSFFRFKKSNFILKKIIYELRRIENFNRFVADCNYFAGFKAT